MRYDISVIMATVDDDDIVVSSTGGISRTVYNIKDRPLNFYVMGSLSSTLGIAIGMALNTQRKVFAIIGDGDILMSLGTLVLAKKLDLPNLEIHIMDNNRYDATGGQKTVSDAADFKRICPCTVHKVMSTSRLCKRIELSPKQIRKRFTDAVKRKLYRK